MRIMAVTKNVSIERILPVLQEHNTSLIGESRWQEAKDKLPFLPKNVETHFIGHLQTNKVTKVVQAFDCIETIDSLKLAGVIDEAGAELNKIVPIFLQINISNDLTKHGFLVENIEQVVEQIRQLHHVRIDGLMTITAKQTAEKTRRDFAEMKKLQIQFGLRELSMGMSDDWQIAVEEGATIVRLGTALFGGRFSAKL